jgi:hypothetical protein
MAAIDNFLSSRRSLSDPERLLQRISLFCLELGMEVFGPSRNPAAEAAIHEFETRALNEADRKIKVACIRIEDWFQRRRNLRLFVKGDTGPLMWVVSALDLLVSEIKASWMLSRLESIPPRVYVELSRQIASQNAAQEGWFLPFPTPSSVLQRDPTAVMSPRLVEHFACGSAMRRWLRGIRGYELPGLAEHYGASAEGADRLSQLFHKIEQRTLDLDRKAATMASRQLAECDRYAKSRTVPQGMCLGLLCLAKVQWVLGRKRRRVFRILVHSCRLESAMRRSLRRATWWMVPGGAGTDIIGGFTRQLEAQLRSSPSFGPETRLTCRRDNVGVSGVPFSFRHSRLWAVARVLWPDAPNLCVLGPTPLWHCLIFVLMIVFALFLVGAAAQVLWQ